MAVTVLRHMKESKKGNPSAHLSHAISYIMNPSKTENGTLIFSNCGTTPQEVFDAMVETKERFQKRWGRQGYHYVISLPPGEGTDDIMYRVAKDFCEELLSDFDYVFAVHNDRDHLHAHIIFNSVSSIDGYKYHYSNGDWARLIQPVTDKLCEKYGLSTLSYDTDEPRVGKSYAEHMAEKNEQLTHRDILRMDMDASVFIADNMEDYYRYLEECGYTWRIGHSKKHGEYVAYKGAFAERAIRDYTLGDGYTIGEIKARVTGEMPDVERHPYEPLQEKVKLWFPDDKLKVYRMSALPRPRYQVYLVSRIEQAVRHYDYDLLLSEQVRVRYDLLQIDRLREECEYLMETGFDSVEALKDRLDVVTYKLKNMKYEDAYRGKYYMEKRTIKHLIRDFDDTTAVRDIEAAPGKDFVYGRKEKLIDERNIGKP